MKLIPQYNITAFCIAPDKTENSRKHAKAYKKHTYFTKRHFLYEDITRSFAKIMSRKTMKPQGVPVAQEWRKVNNDEFYDLYS